MNNKTTFVLVGFLIWGLVISLASPVHAFNLPPKLQQAMKGSSMIDLIKALHQMGGKYSTGRLTIELKNYWEENIPCPVDSKTGKQIDPKCKPLTIYHGDVHVTQIRQTCSNGATVNEDFYFDDDCNDSACPDNYLFAEDYERDQCGAYPTAQCKVDAQDAMKYGSSTTVITGSMGTLIDAGGELKFQKPTCTTSTCYKRCIAKTCDQMGQTYPTNAIYGVFQKYWRTYDTCFHAQYCPKGCSAPSCSAIANTNLSTKSYCQRCGDWSYNYVSIAASDKKKAGRFQCFGGSGDAYKPTPYDPKTQNTNNYGTCGIGAGANETRCCTVKTCAQIADDNGWGSGYDELYNHNMDEYIFDIAANTTSKYAGTHGYVCGKFTKVSQPWVAIGGSNLYAKERIAVNKPNLPGTSNPYFVHADDVCNNNALSGSTTGLLFGKDSGSLANDFGSYKTQRSGSTTLVYPAFDANISNDLRENYDHFANMVKLPSSGSCTDQYAGAKVCYYQPGSGRINISNVDRSESVVVFVKGDLYIDQKVTTTTSQFKAFIVSGQIIVGKGVGTDISEGLKNCPRVSDAHLQGIFIGNQVTFESSMQLQSDYNRGSYCDRQLIIAGTLAAWSGDIKLTRTFKACVLRDSSLPDANSQYPVYTFFSRPDLIQHSPDWMKSVRSQRLETT